jgi:X-X-X-Leu-X-X-Gly heptad repeat protein
VIGMRSLRLPGVAVCVGALSLASAGGAMAQDDVLVTNRESVQVFLNPDGSLNTARIYDQLTAYGTGTVRIENPVATDGLRNLDGFGGFHVQDDKAVVELDIDGDARFRTVSDYHMDLPVSIQPEYRLDGQLVEARDIVGKSGRIDVRYVIRNTTAQPTDLTYFVGAGEAVTVTEQVPLPLVGIFETVLPPSFTSVETGQFNVAGDGRGGTVLRANVVLFPPVSSDTAELRYTAQVTGGPMPEAQFDVVPVQPVTHPNFAGATESYAELVNVGRSFGRGGAFLGDGLDQLHDGASELMAGLILIADGLAELRTGLVDSALPGARELADGSRQAASGAGDLSAGLNNQLAPGARQLADGAGQAASGAGDLSAGLNERLAPGARQLADGAGQAASGAADLSAGLNNQLAPGARQLSEGARRLEQGLGLLAGQLPAAQEGAGLLREGVAEEVLPGLQLLVAGLEQLQAGIADFRAQALAGVDDSVNNVLGGIDSLEGAVVGGIDRLAQCIDGNVAVCVDDPGATGPNLVQGVGGIQNLLDGALGPATEAAELLVETLAGPNCTEECQANVAAALDNLTREDPTDLGVIASLVVARNGLADVLDGLARLREGLGVTFRGQVIGGADLFRSQVRAGAVESRTRFEGGFDLLDEGADELLNGAERLEAGVRTVLLAGLTDLEAGLLGAVGGSNELHVGSQAVAGGAGDLADGAGAAAAGARQLADGNRQLAGGAGELADGAGEAAAGARQLADGNRRLAGGAGELADGAGAAAAGARQLADGALRIADGNQQLAEGLVGAADGSTQLADGAESAAEGVPDLVDGIGQVRDGVASVEDGGDELSQATGTSLAMVRAANERAVNEAMPVGAPEDAIGTAAYSITIAGAAGEGNQNLLRAIIAVALLGLVAGLVALARRRAAL